MILNGKPVGYALITPAQVAAAVGAYLNESGGVCDKLVEIISFTTDEDVASISIPVDSKFIDNMRKFKGLELYANIKRATSVQHSNIGRLSIALRSLYIANPWTADLMSAAYCVPATNDETNKFAEVALSVPRILQPVMQKNIVATTKIGNQAASTSSYLCSYFSPQEGDELVLELISDTTIGAGSVIKLYAWGSLE